MPDKPRSLILNHGSGNVRSLAMAISHLGASVEIASKREDVNGSFTHFFLPGVGSFPAGMRNLTQSGLLDITKDLVRQGTPGLGICLGMQMLFTSSSELEFTEGLGLIPGEVVRLDSLESELEMRPPVLPNIGWRKVHWMDKASNKDLDGLFYFVHSFGVTSKNPMVTANTSFFGRSVAAEVKGTNLTGCQFHPEKSGEVGLEYLRRFLF